MDQRDNDQHDNWAPDSDSPTMPGTSLPRNQVGAAAQTPPPLSGAPTMPYHTPAPPSAQVPSGYASSLAATSITAFLSLQPGVTFAGRYEILNVLGQGGMGAVYQARDKELDRMIALKVIRPELATDPAILQRFKQELILARNITHKNVVRIYDLGESDGQHRDAGHHQHQGEAHREKDEGSPAGRDLLVWFEQRRCRGA